VFGNLEDPAPPDVSEALRRNTSSHVSHSDDSVFVRDAIPGDDWEPELVQRPASAPPCPS
jgi:hypothetical protein